MESFDLVQRLAGLGEPLQAAERAVAAATAYFSARVVAALAREHERMVLVTGRGVEPGILDAIGRTWTSRHTELVAGRALHGPAFEMEPTQRQGVFVLAPVMEGSYTSGLLYVQTDEVRFREARDIDALAQFSRLLAGSLSLTGRPALQDFLERTPADEVARQQLLVLLERHEWNIASVARLLGVTRATIYNRLERHGLERVRVPKTLRRPQIASDPLKSR
jgi:hypothetical protein